MTANSCTTTSERRVRNWLRCSADASSSSPAPAVTASGSAMRLTSTRAQVSVPSPDSVRTYNDVVASSAAVVTVLAVRSRNLSPSTIRDVVSAIVSPIRRPEVPHHQDKCFDAITLPAYWSRAARIRVISSSENGSVGQTPSPPQLGSS